MKNKRFTLIASIVLVIAMLFGTLSVGAVDGETTNVEITTQLVTATTTPADETTTVPAGEMTTTPADETTTDNNSGYDDSDYETDEEKDAYDDGYWDGYWDGYEDAKDEYKDKDYDDGYNDGYDDGRYDGEWDGYYDGYYEGYYDAIQEMEDKKVVTIFDRWDAFVEELRYRIEMFKERLVDFFQRIFKKGPYEEFEETVLTDTSFIPNGTQATLEDDTDAQALCDEFNALINGFCNEVPDDVYITKTADVDATVGDLPPVISGVVNSLVESFVGITTSEQFVEKGDWAYYVQETNLFPAGLAEASKTVNEDGTTDYKFVLIEEAAYYNGNETYGVKLIDGEVVYCTLQHEYVADALYIEAADLNPAIITEAKIVYPGATITATTDAHGRLVKYDVNMPVKGSGTGKIQLINVTVSLEGYRNEGYVMDYDV